MTPYFVHIGMVSDDRGMGIRGEWIITLKWILKFLRRKKRIPKGDNYIKLQ